MTNAENYFHSLLTFGIRPGLDRIKILLERLGNPEKSLRFIHVAGTNGKGTVCSLIASVLESAGYKTGLYTSPYIVDFRERIRVNGEMISEKDLDSVTESVKTEIEKLRNEDVIITEFEAVTAAAFLHYKNAGCDFVVLETGLGGRFDATNVIERPLMSIITSISLDHVNILGNNLAEIAYEKCGIIKNECPVVTCSSQSIEALKVISEQSKIHNSELYIADIASYSLIDESIEGSTINFGSRQVKVPFPGEHQCENCIVALTAVDILKKEGVAISETAIKRGVEKTKNPARCEIVSNRPYVIFDGCHNEGSAKALACVIKKHLKNKKITAVMGMMEDKDVTKVLSLLCNEFDSMITVTPSNPRAMKAEKLAELAKKYCKNVQSFENELEGLKFAVNSLEKDGVLLVCGSLYLCSDLYKYFRKDY